MDLYDRRSRLGCCWQTYADTTSAAGAEISSYNAFIPPDCFLDEENMKAFKVLVDLLEGVAGSQANTS